MLDCYNMRKPSQGTLYLTATHLIFVDPENKKETWFPLSSEIEVSSVAVGHIIKLPYNSEIKNSSLSYEIKTTIYQIPPPQKIKIPPLWIYVLSVFTVGIIIALVYLLYKVNMNPFYINIDD
ncbi:uncharacterized protein LOC142331320 [Lycorma delicatula]|uniref:uncharacterized protein LOC142331320 n=1 Tax=Lycorma delicatula TaxID=130591 RepID=UPI003F515E17